MMRRFRVECRRCDEWVESEHRASALEWLAAHECPQPGPDGGGHMGKGRLRMRGRPGDVALALVCGLCGALGAFAWMLPDGRPAAVLLWVFALACLVGVADPWTRDFAWDPDAEGP